MFWICSRPAPPELMPGSMVLTIFAASGSRSVVSCAAPDGLGVPELEGVQAATASTTSRDSAISFLMHLLLAGKPAPNAGRITTRESAPAGPTRLALDDAPPRVLVPNPALAG